MHGRGGGAAETPILPGCLERPRAMPQTNHGKQTGRQSALPAISVKHSCTQREGGIMVRCRLAASVRAVRHDWQGLTGYAEAFLLHMQHRSGGC